MEKRKVKSSTLARNLNKVLKDKGLSLRAAAKLAGIPYSTIGDWSSGAAPTDLTRLAKLAAALDVSFEFLCLGREAHHSKLHFTATESEFSGQEKILDGVYKIVAIRLKDEKSR